MSGKLFEITEIKEVVRTRYGGIAAGSVSDGCAPAASCCGITTTSAVDAREMGYSAEELAAVPQGANLGLGCGNPQAVAAVKPGAVIADLSP
jgi:hypothetical protein